MRGIRTPGGWLLALVLVWYAPLVAAHAKPAAPQTETHTGNISGSPMGTWMTLTFGGTPPSTFQVDIGHAKITDKGKALKRYGLADGWKVRVKGTHQGSAFVAETVEVLEHSKPPKKPG